MGRVTCKYPIYRPPYVGFQFGVAGCPPLYTLSTPKCKIAINMDHVLHPDLLGQVEEHLSDLTYHTEPIRHCGVQIVGTVAQSQQIYATQCEDVITDMKKTCAGKALTTQQLTLYASVMPWHED
jgi:hypothetical protein